MAATLITPTTIRTPDEANQLVCGLVVNDDLESRMTAAAALGELGYPVTQAGERQQR
jgi:hypothetical protein